MNDTNKRPSLRDLAKQIEETGRAHPCWSQAQPAVRQLTEYLTARARIEEMNRADNPTAQCVEFWYQNYKGETSLRQVRIVSLRWGTSDWYKQPQWLVLAWDFGKEDMREFSLYGMSQVKPIREGTT